MRTKTLSKGEIVRVGEVSTTTAARECLVFYFDFSELKKEAPPPGFTNVEDVIARYEREPGKKEEIKRARKWIAERFHSNERDTLRALRLRKGLSQSDLAERLGTTQSHVARIENGQNVEVETLTRIAHALDADPILIFKAFIKQYSKVK